MEEKELKAKDIPWGYPLCFNNECADKDKCMHYQTMHHNVPQRQKAEACQCVHALFGGGNGQ